MSETKNEVAAENFTRVGGGECTPEQLIIITGQLTDAYEALVDFTSYVFGRMAGDPPTQP
jgi:hypothetical protein